MFGFTENWELRTETPRLVRPEIDCDLCLNFDWRTIQIIWLISPLADGFDRGSRKNWRSPEHFCIPDETFFVNGRFNLHCALSMSKKCVSRIFWLYPPNEKPFGDALRDLDGCDRQPGNT